MTDKFKQYTEYECSCDACKFMCRRPCWGTIDEIKKIIDADLGHKLMVDYYSGDADEIEILCPALKGSENCRAPFWPMSAEGCTFWNKDRLCDLHCTKLKPLEGRNGYHEYKEHNLHQELANHWNCDEARELIKQWRKNMNEDLKKLIEEALVKTNRTRIIDLREYIPNLFGKAHSKSNFHSFLKKNPTSASEKIRKYILEKENPIKIIENYCISDNIANELFDFLTKKNRPDLAKHFDRHNTQDLKDSLIKSIQQGEINKSTLDTLKKLMKVHPKGQLASKDLA